MVIPNATHINGIPVEDYKPTRRDLRKGLVVTVADPAAVSASAVTSTTATQSVTETGQSGTATTATADAVAETTTAAETAGAAAATTAASTTTSTASTTTSATSGGATSIFGAAVAAAVPAVVIGSELAPDGDYLSALVQQDGQKLRVTLVDRSSGKPISAQISELPAAGASVIHVSGLGADAELEQALRAYATVCEVNLQSVVNWAQQPGTTSRTSAGFALMTDTCPGLWKYARPNR